MKAKRVIAVVAALTVVGAGVALGVVAWRERVVARMELRAYEAARTAVRANRAGEALALVQSGRRAGSKLDWAGVEFEALVVAKHVARLALAYQRDPERVLGHERASLLLARAFFHGQNRADLDRIRSHWRGREVDVPLWLALDADLAMLSGRRDEAERLLRSKKFEGEAEAMRLVRLALLISPWDLKGAYDLLDEASRVSPRTPDVRSFRGQVLEAIGKGEMARVEYVAAVVADPGNPVLRDQLAEFYRRQGDDEMALRTWSEALGPPSLDFIWLKAMFWGRVLGPLPEAVRGLEVPGGELGALAGWLRQLPAGRYWGTNGLDELAGVRSAMQTRQEVYWLRVLDALQGGREKEAAAMLAGNRFRTRSWEPDLETALRRVLHYRAAGSLNPPDFAAPVTETNRHSFYTELEVLAKAERTGGGGRPSAELDGFLRGRGVFAGLVMAAGWREAALGLGAGEGAQTGPEWFLYGTAQALKYNRGNAAALKYLGACAKRPLLEMLAGEVQIADGKPKDGLARLEPLAGLDSDVGYRAAWMLALAALDWGRYEEARGWIKGQGRLAASVTGRELLARVALAEGKAEEAERLYRALAGESIEARVYLARRAFEGKRWGEARKYTVELIEQMPDELKFRENLLVIEKAEAGR